MACVVETTHPDHVRTWGRFRAHSERAEVSNLGEQGMGAAGETNMQEGEQAFHIFNSYIHLSPLARDQGQDLDAE